MMQYNKEINRNEPMRMLLAGKGQVMANPDIAILRLGVQTNGDDLTSAQAQNAALSQNVLNALHQLGITDIKTVQYQINKVYDFVEGKQVDRGYQVRNILEIRTDQMNSVGNIIDTAVYYGANVVDSITFDVEDPSKFYQQALNLAVEDAIEKAESILANLQIFATPVPILITENSNAPIPFRTRFAAGEIALSTPIEPGNMQIEANVTVEFVY